MTLPILHVTDDLTRWGPGIARLLTAPEFDRNNWTFEQAIEALQTALLEVAGSRTTAITTRPGSTALTFTYADGTSLDVPFTPILQRFKGEWAPGVLLDQLDFFTVNEKGFFVSLVPHTTGAVFDADATDDDSNPLYKFLIRYSQLSDLTDLDWGLTNPLQDGDVPIWDDNTSKLTNQRPKYILSPAALSGVLINSQKLLYHKFPKGVTFPADFGPYLGYISCAGGSANATASTVITVAKATAASPNTFATIGTITIAAGSVTATLVTSGHVAIAFAQNDVIRMVGPVSADGTFADFYCTLVGHDT